MKTKQELTKFTIMNWNVAGAKYLEDPELRREEFRLKINETLTRLVKTHEPDVITLQELVQFGPEKKNLINPPPGYKLHVFTLIDTERLSIRAKWDKVEHKGNWPKGTFFAQGNGFLFKEDLPHQPLWALPKAGAHRTNMLPPHYVEKVGLESGLYFGDRDTEPRAALVAHFVFNPRGIKPLDIFVVNVHLTTLTMEREGVPEIDRLATRVRLAQLDIIFDGIVSRYNRWKRGGFLQRGEHRKAEKWETFNRHEPVWIVTGDFNFTPTSVEYQTISNMNFMDVVPTKGAGTKSPGAGNRATLTLDYVFAGPAFVSLDPLILPAGITGNQVHDERVSDHFPMVAIIPVWD